MTIKTYHCWQCAHFKADEPDVSTVGRCHRFAPHALDYYGFSGIQIETPVTTKGDLYTHDGTEDARLPVGADGEILFADSAEPTGQKWGPVPSGTSPLMTKGDIYGHDTVGDIRIPVGTDGQILKADATEAAGVKWSDPPPMPYIAYGVSESESSTTSESYVEKLNVSFEATAGVRYRIDFCFLLGAYLEEDVDGRCQVNNSVDLIEAHFKNFSPYSELWSDGSAGFWLSDSLSGTVNVDIDYKRGFGSNAQKIKMARIVVTRVDDSATSLLAALAKVAPEKAGLEILSLLAPIVAAPTSAGKYGLIVDGSTMWCGEFQRSPRTIPPVP